MQQLAESHPVQVICRVWEMPRSTYYYRSQALEEHELRTALQRLAGEWPRYGSQHLTTQLQREGFPVNRKHIQRLMRELGVQGVKRVGEVLKLSTTMWGSIFQTKFPSRVTFIHPIPLKSSIAIEINLLYNEACF